MNGVIGSKRAAYLGALFAAVFGLTACMEVGGPAPEVPAAPGEATTTTAAEATTTTAAGATTTAPEATTTTAAEATTTTEAVNPNEVSAIEVELLALVNELRIEPDGRLKRANDAQCVLLDPDTNQAPAAPAVTLHEKLSLEVARPWAEQLTLAKLADPDTVLRDDNPGFELREAIIGVDIKSMAWNENVAGIESAEATALDIFTVWRDGGASYCDLMNPTMTGAGVGISVEGDTTFADLVLFVES